MTHGNDRSTPSGLLDELDDIRSLLDDSLPVEAIPVLEDAVDASDPAIPVLYEAAPAELEPFAPAELEGIPLLDDAVADGADDDLDLYADDAPFIADEALTDPSLEPVGIPVPPREGPAPFPPGATVAELLAGQSLQIAIRNRIDATFEHWVNETLQQELTLLRARLLEAVRAEVHEFVATQINRANVTGKPHGE